MRIVFFGNTHVAVKVIDFLRSKGEEVAGLVLHDEGKRVLGDEIAAAAGLPPSSVISAGDLKSEPAIQRLRELNADIGFSALFGHILKPPVLTMFPRGILNVHPGYLPWNRGRNAQVWAIIEHTPAGATLHYMNEGVDTGPIVDRIEVPVEPTDTGASLRVRLEQACVDVVKRGWPAVVAGVTPAPQDPSEGTSHRAAEVERIGRLDLDATYRGGDLIDLLRALTSQPMADGAYFDTPQGRVRVRVELESNSSPGQKKSPSGRKG